MNKQSEIERAVAQIDHLMAMCKAQTAALQIALDFIQTVGSWQVPYSHEAMTASDLIAKELAAVTETK